jgi:hypothetical protein
MGEKRNRRKKSFCKTEGGFSKMLDLAKPSFTKNSQLKMHKKE